MIRGGVGIFQLFLCESFESSAHCLAMAAANPVMAFGDSPVQVTCPICRHTAVTIVEYSAGLLTYLFCGGLFFFGCFLGCCLIPFCVDRVRDVKHSCSNCRAFLGVYKRL